MRSTSQQVCSGVQLEDSEPQGCPWTTCGSAAYLGFDDHKRRSSSDRTWQRPDVMNSELAGWWRPIGDSLSSGRGTRPDEASHALAEVGGGVPSHGQSEAFAQVGEKTSLPDHRRVLAMSECRFPRRCRSPPLGASATPRSRTRYTQVQPSVGALTRAESFRERRNLRAS